jgi:hypothetical protein
MHTQASSDTLSHTQLSHFTAQGWLHIAGMLDAVLLERLRIAVENLCTAAEPKTHIAEVTGSDGMPHVICINSIVPKKEPVFTEVLASPWLRGIAQSICGPDYFLVQDFTVIKNLGDGAPVNWHQDVVSSQPGKAIMVGLYLDASDHNNGALCIVPESHRIQAGICELEKMPHQSLNMQPGDVLVHDLMLAHSSGVLNTQQKRRVVYFEFMSAAHAINESIYTPEFVAQRSRVLPAAMKATQGDAAAKNEIQEVYAKELKVKAAAYCFEAFSGVMQ